MKLARKPKRLRPFPKFKKLQHTFDGSIVAQFKYQKYYNLSHSAWWGAFHDLKIELSLEALKIRIRMFEYMGWPTTQERKALEKFKKLGLK